MPFTAPTPVPALSAPPAHASSAAPLVIAGWNSAQSYANDAFASAQNFLTEIGSLSTSIADLPDVNVVLSPVAAAVRAYVSPTAPTEPTGLSMNMPPAPGTLTLGTVAPLSIASAPEFTAVALPVNLPTVPSALTTAAPTLPTLADVTTPTMSALTLPDVPTLLGISIPGAPTLSMPAFGGMLAIAPTAPGNTFAFTEAAYTSSLLTSLRTILQTWVEGANTGLTPTVEQAIWNRSRAREAATAARKMQETLRDFASRGFTKPPGAMALALQDALQNSQDVDLAASREVAINQAKLEQDNRHFAFEQAFKVEADLIQYQNNIAQRAFDAAKYAQEAAISIFVALVQSYGAQVQAYVAQSQVFKTLIDAELSKLEVYKAQLEGQKLIGELNVQSVEIYKARITAAMSLVEIFKAQVEAANLTLQGNKIRIDGFAATVQAYDSTVRAKATEYQGYAAQVQAEVSKIEVFKGQADAYRSQVTGYSAGVQALTEAKKVELEIAQRVPLEAYKVGAEVFRIETEAEAQRVNAGTKVYETRAQVFGERVSGEGTRVNSEVAVFKAQSDVAVSEGQLRIEAAKANIQKLMQQITLLVESVKAGAQVSAQLAASALSAVNLSGQIGDHTSYSSSISMANSASNSAAMNSSNQTSDSTSTSEINSTSTSDSTSENTNYNHNIEDF